MSIRKILLLSSLCLLLNSCFTKEYTHGYPEDKSLVEKLQIGVTTQDQALEILGDPSTKSTFNPDIWYYISSKMKAKGFLKAKITNEQVMKLSFKKSKLSEIVFTDNITHQEIVFNKDKSHVGGDDSGVLKDFFHNFGRFNKALGRK